MEVTDETNPSGCIIQIQQDFQVFQTLYTVSYLPAFIRKDQLLSMHILDMIFSFFGWGKKIIMCKHTVRNGDGLFVFFSAFPD